MPCKTLGVAAVEQQVPGVTGVLGLPANTATPRVRLTIKDQEFLVRLPAPLYKF